VFKKLASEDQPAPSRSESPSMLNAMTIDVEDYFQVSAFKGIISPNDWNSYDYRVDANTNKVLDLLAQTNTKATFFTLGWVAQRSSSLIRRIVDDGHELASHGYGHQMITDLDMPAFREDVIRAKYQLEDTSGKRVLGYRAPSFSIGKSTLWAHDVLKETGHVYSSSIYPIKHDLYGMPDAPRFVHELPSGLIEIPASSVRLQNKNFPSSGGGFFRLFPLWLSKLAIRSINDTDRQAAIFYCHPWEFDPQQPRILNASRRSKFRHYINLESSSTKFESLLTSFQWSTMSEVFAESLKGRIN
jgi:polysaccharide deacetylase family protein (PEP-CTERM system associated)